MSELPNEMRAAILHGKQDVRIENVPLPVLLPGELLLKIEAALTCGTDLKVFRRGDHATMLKPPCPFGHECAGTVVALAGETGSRAHRDVPAFEIGTRVVVANSAPCGACYWCQRAQENLCADLQFLNGAYAEYLRVPARFVERNTYLLPEDLAFEEAAMTEPLACVLHGLEELAPQAGERAAVIGLGPIGLLFVALLKARGCKVIGVGRHAPRLELARKLGAHSVLDADTDDRWVATLKTSEKLDLVIEATGLPEVWSLALNLVRRGGRVNLFGGCAEGSRVELDTRRLHYDQLTIRSSFHHRPADIQAALKAIAAGVIKPREFISEEKALEELPTLFKEMLTAKRQVKALIRMT